jgi:glycosyltransferase involved in cell wall biosynthesis
MLASFLSQEYDDKELLIINDDKDVQLTYTNKNCNDKIHIINLNKRLSLGSKRNLGSAFGSYDLYMPHDDDDIFLHNRISNHVIKHKENPNIYLYRNNSNYLLYGNEFSEMRNNLPSAISYKQKGWYECGGYADMNSGEDQDFYERVQNKLEEYDSLNTDYVYNYGGLNYHSSCTQYEDIEVIANRQLKDLDVYKSTFDIVPDCDEYDKFIALDKIFKSSSSKEGLHINHTDLGKIDISHLHRL